MKRIRPLTTTKAGMTYPGSLKYEAEYKRITGELIKLGHLPPLKRKFRPTVRNYRSSI